MFAHIGWITFNPGPRRDAEEKPTRPGLRGECEVAPVVLAQQAIPPVEAEALTFLEVPEAFLDHGVSHLRSADLRSRDRFQRAGNSSFSLSRNAFTSSSVLRSSSTSSRRSITSWAQYWPESTHSSLMWLTSNFGLAFIFTQAWVAGLGGLSRIAFTSSNVRTR